MQAGKTKIIGEAYTVRFAAVNHRNDPRPPNHFVGHPLLYGHCKDGKVSNLAPIDRYCSKGCHSLHISTCTFNQQCVRWTNVNASAASRSKGYNCGRSRP